MVEGNEEIALEGYFVILPKEEAQRFSGVLRLLLKLLHEKGA